MKIAVLVTLQLEAAAVDQELGAFLDAEIDIAFDLFQMRPRDHRAVIGLRVGRRSDLQAFDPRHQFFQQPVCGLRADRHRHRNGHAALAGGAVAGADQRIDGLVEVGVRHHDHVVLGAAETLRAFVVGAGGRVDIFRDRRRADEADRLDARIGQDGVDRLLVAVDDVEHARRQPGLEQQLREPHRHGRIAFRRLEDEGIAAGERRREFPHRDHGGEIERRDAGDDAKRLAHGIKVDTGTGTFAEFALEKVRNAAGEFDHLEAALDVALGVRERLAVLGGKEPRQAVEFLLRQVEELEQDARAPLRVGRGPADLRRFRHRDGVLGLGMLGERHLGLHLAGIGIEHVAETTRCPLDLFPADEVTDLTHGRSP